MRTTLLTLGLLLAAAAAAIAQVPRTINYQGRVNGPGGTPITGDHTMTLKIWDAATGGTALYSETQTVTFRGGVFTVAIGGGTPGGIPASIPFDKQYWLGVAISGVNSGNELVPRFILRSSPYSLHSAIADVAATADSANRSAQAVRALRADRSDRADSARYADTAANVLAPIDIAAPKGTTRPTLRVAGSGYALVTAGVDSTTKYFVSGDTTGNTLAPTPGATYRDNTAMAWGQIDRAGTLLSDFGITSVTYTQATGTYEITLDNPVHISSKADPAYPEMAVAISLGGGQIDFTGDIQPVTTLWGLKRLPTNAYDPRVIQVRFYNLAGNTVQRPYSIVVFGRP